LAAINGLEFGMIMTGILLFSQFILAFITASTYKSKITFINIILILSLPILIVGVFQGIWGEATSKLWVSGAENLINSRAYGFFGSPNILGSLSMITIIASLFSFLEKKKWYYLVYLLLALIALILTFSRSAWLGLSIGLVVALLIKNWKLIIFAPFSLILLIIPSIRQRLFVATSQIYLVDATLDGRVWSFNNAIEIFKTAPLIGTGPGSYGGQTAIYYNSPIYLQGMQNGYIALPYTDNQWLQVLVQTGIIGFLSVAGFFISHIINNLRQYRKTGDYISLGIIAATIAIFVNGLFANIWEFGAIAVLSGAYLGLGNYYEK
jgi:O-antigen ligase